MSRPKQPPPKTDTPKKRPSPTERGFRATRLTLSKAHQRILDAEADFAGVRRSQFLENLLRIRSGSPGGFLRRDGAPVYEFRENDLTDAGESWSWYCAHGARGAAANPSGSPPGWSFPERPEGERLSRRASAGVRRLDAAAGAARDGVSRSLRRAASRTQDTKARASREVGVPRAGSTSQSAGPGRPPDGTAAPGARSPGRTPPAAGAPAPRPARRPPP